jgi:2-polyprenyl-6-methoxyphenol hydroxylase-like FAD-dependent oxidoreductase
LSAVPQAWIASPAVVDAVVIGAGAAGLGTALALARSGRTVTLLERDDASLPDNPDAAFTSWERRGAPQVRHSHAFLARMRVLLTTRAPDLLTELLDEGAEELRFCDHLPPTLVGFEPEPDDGRLVALGCRRTTFEWVLRRAVLAEPGVAVRGGTAVAGLDADERGGVPHIVGVRTALGEVIRSGLVVDASGRNSASSSWLARAGAARCDERESDVGIVYSSRFYRLVGGARRPEGEGIIGGDLGYLKYAVFPADGGTFSITFAVPSDDAALRGVMRPAAFDALARALPSTAEWLADGRALPVNDDVAVMARLVNRRRRLVVDGRPVATGLLLVGDAAVCTNPLYGRGATLAMVHGYALADTLTGTDTDDPSDVAVAFDAVTRDELEPWYRAAVAQDGVDLAARGAKAGYEGSDESVSPLALRSALMAVTRTDPRVWRAFVRTFNLLDPPDTLVSDPYVVGKVLEALQAGAEGLPPFADAIGPTREETVRMLALAS